MLLILIISLLGKVLADSSVEVTTETVTSQIESTPLPNLPNFTTPTSEEQNPIYSPSSKSEGIVTLSNEQNTSEIYQSDQRAEFNKGDELGNSTEHTTTTEEEDEHIDWLENDEFTTDSEPPSENFNDTLNGSDLETVEGDFDNSDTTDSPFDLIDESLFNSTNNNETSADDIFNTSQTATAEDVLNKLKNDMFNNTFNNETASPSSTNLSGILQAWLSERGNVTIEPSPMPSTKPYLGPLGDEPLFLGRILDDQGDVCISINVSIQPILDGTPLRLSQPQETTESYTMKNGSIQFHATDNDKAYNVTTEFHIHCNEKSCGVELVSFDVRNSTNRQTAVLNAELSRVNMGTPSEDISKRTLNVTDEIQLEINYMSVFVSVRFCVLGNFFKRHYVEIICGVGVFVTAMCLTFFIVRKIRRGKNSFDTMM